jgi:hypothetical protein
MIRLKIPGKKILKETALKFNLLQEQREKGRQYAEQGQHT